ncbi:hypothetical protein GCM10009115_14540 [Sphingopyxis soli]|uniref:Uncharacterized protein n=1 Tax=Sphingopyxis soli TaxID=592051 RepID=A0ABP3XD76_9SPHN
MHEIVAMLLAARKRARVAAQKGQVPADFVSQRHVNAPSYRNEYASLRGRVPPVGSEKRPFLLQLVGRECVESVGP